MYLIDYKCNYSDLIGLFKDVEFYFIYDYQQMQWSVINFNKINTEIYKLENEYAKISMGSEVRPLVTSTIYA